jgi:hypothetical protein
MIRHTQIIQVPQHSRASQRKDTMTPPAVDLHTSRLCEDENCQPRRSAALMSGATEWIG